MKRAQTGRFRTVLHCGLLAGGAAEVSTNDDDFLAARRPLALVRWAEQRDCANTGRRRKVGYAAVVAQIHGAAIQQCRRLGQSQVTCDYATAAQRLDSASFLLHGTDQQDNCAASRLAPPLTHREEIFGGPVFFPGAASGSDCQYRLALKRMARPKVFAPADGFVTKHDRRLRRARGPMMQSAEIMVRLVARGATGRTKRKNPRSTGRDRFQAQDKFRIAACKP